MDRLDRRQRPAVGQADQSDVWLVRPAEDPIVISRAQIQPRQPLELSRSGQRAVLFESRRPRPGALSGCGSIGAMPTAPPTRSRMRKSIRASQSVRAARTSQPARITATPPASSGCACFPIPLSMRPRQSAGTANGITTIRAITCRRIWCGRTASACLAASVMSAPNPEKPPADAEAPTIGESEFDRRRAIFLGRSHPGLERRSIEFSVSGPAHRAAGVARHLAGLDRQHQQSAHDERDLQFTGRGSRRPKAGAGRPWVPTTSPTGSSTTSSRPGR